LKLSKYVLFICCCCLLSGLISRSEAARVKVNVKVIIDKLPIEKEQKMRDFHLLVQEYLENVHWLEEDDEAPIEVSVQLFLQESSSNVEDRYNCELLVSSSDIQYFDKRIRFPYQPGDVLVYDDQSVGALTGVLNFYMNMIMASELDKYREMGGEFYYKRALNFAALGKFVRVEFSGGWNERDELIRRIDREPFRTFRTMKDFYFFGLYLINNQNKELEGRESILHAIGLLESVFEQETKLKMEEHTQFIDSHYNQLIQLFENDVNGDQVFNTLIKIDPDRADTYRERLSGS